MQRYFLSLLHPALLLLILCATCTVQAQRTTVCQRKDFNADGYPDSLLVHRDSGSGFGSTSVTVVNGKTHERLVWESSHCFCTISDVVWVPMPFLRPENAAFRLAAESHLRTPARQVADPSLTYVLSGLRTVRRFEPTPVSTVWSAFQPTMTGGSGRFTLASIPASYSVSLEEPVLRTLMGMGYLQEDEGLEQGQEGWLSYAAHVHLGTVLPPNEGQYPQVLDSLHGRTLVATAQGLVLQDTKGWKWIWVTDRHLTGAPDKLRWNSVHQALFLDARHVLLRYTFASVAEQALALIDLDASRVTLMETPDGCRGCDIQMRDGDLWLVPAGEGDGQQAISLSTSDLIAQAHAVWE